MNDSLDNECSQVYDYLHDRRRSTKRPFRNGEKDL